MGFVEKTDYLLETKSMFKDRLNSLGAEITEQTTFRNYLVWLNNLYNKLQDMTVTGLGCLEGYTTQTGTPTPTSPQPIDVRTGRQVVSVSDGITTNDYEINLGKNLFNKDSVVLGKVWNGGTNTKRAYGYIVAEQNQTYTVSTQNTDSDLTVYVVETTTVGQAGTNVRQVTVTPSTPQTFIPKTNTIYIAIQFSNATNNTTQTMVDNAKVQIEKGSLTSYTPYKPPIELCKIGDYQDFIGCGTGKNLLGGFIFDKINSNITFHYNEDGSINCSGTSNANAFSMFTSDATPYLKTLEVGTYTLSGGTSDVYIQIMNSSGNRVAETTASVFTKTFTISETTQVYFRAYVISGKTINNTIYPMLEKGSSQTSYEPYGEGKWYIHKEIGRVVLNGSESNFNYTNGVYYSQNSNLLHFKLNTPVVSNYFTYGGTCNNTTTAYNNGNNKISLHNADDYRFYLRNDNLTSKSDWTTWLSSHNVEVYYVLATPTTTEIEDEELINQLNEIEIFEYLKGGFGNEID